MMNLMSAVFKRLRDNCERFRDNCEMLRYKKIDATQKENTTIQIGFFKVRFIFCHKYINYSCDA